MTKKERNYLIAYIICGFMSFGYAWNHPTEWDQVCWTYGITIRYTDSGERKLGNVSCGWIPAIKSIAAGVFWPIYAPGVFAIHVTKWP